MKKLFLMTLVLGQFLISCTQDEVIPVLVDEDDAIQSMIDEYYFSVTPTASRADAPVITSISRQSYQAVGDTVLKIERLGRANVDSAFDIATVKFRVRGQDGYAVMSDSPKGNQMYFFTDNGSIADTAYIEPLKEIVDKAPFFEVKHWEFSHNGGGGLSLGDSGSSSQDLLLGPIVRFNWGQGYPFNMFATACSCGLCSKDYYNGHRPIGCVATATAQAIAAMGKFEGTFYGTKDIKFSELPSYGWAMTGSQQKVVGHFLHEIALCCQIKFECGGSGSTIKAAYQYLKDLGYNCEYVTGGVVQSKLIKELEAGIPHLIAGSNDDGGHMWIIDGIKIKDGVVYFHCNWGWNGASNCWTIGNPYTPSGMASYNKNVRNIYIYSKN